MMRLIMAIGLIVAFPTIGSTQEEVDQLPINPLSFVRVFADDEGESHFEDSGLALTNLEVGGGVSAEASVMQDLVGVTFFCFAAGTRVDWHPAPRRQFYFILSGQLVLEVSDGEKRHFQAGDIILGEATEGRGVRAQWRGSERACVGVAPVRASLQGDWHTRSTIPSPGR